MDFVIMGLGCDCANCQKNRKEDAELMADRKTEQVLKDSMTDPAYGEPASSREMTIGEYRVGIDSNPSNSEEVRVIKARAAGLIDYLQSLLLEHSEASELREIACHKVEEAAMWAVKAVTKKPPPR